MFLGKILNCEENLVRLNVLLFSYTYYRHKFYTRKANEKHSNQISICLLAGSESHYWPCCFWKPHYNSFIPRAYVQWRLITGAQHKSFHPWWVKGRLKSSCKITGQLFSEEPISSTMRLTGPDPFIWYSTKPGNVLAQKTDRKVHSKMNITSH